MSSFSCLFSASNLFPASKGGSWVFGSCSCTEFAVRACTWLRVCIKIAFKFFKRSTSADALPYFSFSSRFSSDVVRIIFFILISSESSWSFRVWSDSTRFLVLVNSNETSAYRAFEAFISSRSSPFAVLSSFKSYSVWSMRVRWATTNSSVVSGFEWLFSILKNFTSFLSNSLSASSASMYSSFSCSCSS